jgi:RNA polymerase sigma-70 factor, ECF subfamily
VDELCKTLVETHWVSVYRFVRHLGLPHADAEDITQQTFVRAFAAFASLQPGTNPKAWLFRIAKNLRTDHLRKLRRSTDQAVPEIPSHDFAGMEIRDEAEVVRRALVLLPEMTREVFLLRVEGEWAFAQIATELAISAEAARWHMGQARLKLRGFLQ